MAKSDVPFVKSVPPLPLGVNSMSEFLKEIPLNKVISLKSSTVLSYLNPSASDIDGLVSDPVPFTTVPVEG